MESSDLQQILDHALQSHVPELLSKFNIPVLAVGVVHRGVIAYEGFFGHHDASSEGIINRDNIFHIASLTKAFTAAMVGILVDKGLLSWGTPVHDILPETSSNTVHYTSKLTVADLLSHRSGTSAYPASVHRVERKKSIGKKDYIRIWHSLPVLHKPGTKLIYNDYAYNIVGLVIERLSKENWGSLVHKLILNPLGMNRTFASQPKDENSAVVQAGLHDDATTKITPRDIHDQTVEIAGQSLTSSLGDLLTWSNVWLKAIGEDILSLAENKEPIIANPLRQLRTILAPHIFMDDKYLPESTYTLGWRRLEEYLGIPYTTFWHTGSAYGGRS